MKGDIEFEAKEHQHRFQLAGYRETSKDYKAAIYLFCECGEDKRILY